MEQIKFLNYDMVKSNMAWKNCTSSENQPPEEI